jgi:hypothetical protein
MGKFSSSTNNVIQTVNLGNSIFATPVFWQNNLYLAGVGPLMQFVFNKATGKFNGAPFSQSSTSFRFPGSTPSVSSNGAANASSWRWTIASIALLNRRVAALLAVYSQAQFDRVALRLNQRPRQTLDFQTPASKLHASVASTV